MTILYEYEQNISHLSSQMSTNGMVSREKNNTCKDTISIQNDLRMLEDWIALISIKFYRDKGKVQQMPSKSTVQAQIRSRHMHEQN